jgi:hypothetical protein
MHGAAGTGLGGHAPHAEDTDWIEPERPKRDWKKFFLVIGLGTLSWVATYVGMLELVQANMGELSLLNKVIIGFSVAMLMTMIIWLLDQMFAPLPFMTKAAYVAGYLFLTLVSVGFGFGFYWKVLESRSEASRSAESAISQVQAALFGASSRLDQLQTTLDQLHRISNEKAIIERDSGASCPNSRPGDGPRRKLRDADAARFSFASEFVKGRSGKVKADMRALDGELKKITSRDPSIVDPVTGTRNKFLQGLTRQLELTATGFNAFRTDPQLRQIRTELAERSTQTVFPTGRGNATFTCPDPQLQSALRGVVRAIDQLPELGKPQIATVEGAQAVVEAFRRLTVTLYGVLSFKLPPSADDLRALQQKAVQSAENNAAQRQAQIGAQQGGLSQRDYIPLAIAMFVDLCLLLVSIGRPLNRLHNLVPKMREAERGPVYQILSRFDDIHRDEEVREKFEIFRHVVFDFHGDYYVAVPLDAPRRRNPEEIEKLQLEAHLLGNLFASFEKERIFTRVYNPLLNRKMIERKLERQGSKFATSSAFRVYRFRDGAWSDIILGAVMGAARRANAQRRREAFAHGPMLDVPASVPVEASKPAADDIPKEPANREHAGGKEPSFDFRSASSAEELMSEIEETLDDAALRAKYGPYAERMMQRSREGHRRPDPSRWPYRRPPEPIGEADVKLAMPGGLHERPGAETFAENGRPPANTTPRSSRISIPSGNDLRGRLSGAASVADAGTPGTADIIPLPASRPPLPSMMSQAGPGSGHDKSTVPREAGFQKSEADPTSATRINIRLTERTADFSMPVSEASLPDALFDLARTSAEHRTETVAGHDPHEAARTIRVAEASLPMIAFADRNTDARMSEDVPETEGAQPRQSDLPAVWMDEDARTLPPLSAGTQHRGDADHGNETGEITYHDDASEFPALVAGTSDDQDPMLKAARRFAARSPSDN